jgi:hypothetical protein
VLISGEQSSKRKGMLSMKYKKSTSKKMSKQDRKDLQTLASDFCLLNRKDIQEIIKNSKNYAESQQKIMRVYMAVYLS